MMTFLFWFCVGSTFGNAMAAVMTKRKTPFFAAIIAMIIAITIKLTN